MAGDMENTQSYEKKLKAYQRKKLEYEMLEVPLIDDEVFKKNSIPEIIEALKLSLGDGPQYDISDSRVLMVAEPTLSYDVPRYKDDKIQRFIDKKKKASEAEKKKLDKGLEEYLSRPSEKLCDFIHQKQRELNKFGSEIYLPVYMSRKTYSKLISDQTKEPKFETCVQLIFGLNLNIDDANKLLRLAGKAFSDSEYHRTVRYFVEQRQYDIDALNETLIKLNYEAIGCE